MVLHSDWDISSESIPSSSFHCELFLLPADPFAVKVREGGCAFILMKRLNEWPHSSPVSSIDPRALLWVRKVDNCAPLRRSSYITVVTRYWRKNTFLHVVKPNLYMLTAPTPAVFWTHLLSFALDSDHWTPANASKLCGVFHHAAIFSSTAAFVKGANVEVTQIVFPPGRAEPWYNPVRPDFLRRRNEAATEAALQNVGDPVSWLWFIFFSSVRTVTAGKLQLQTGGSVSLQNAYVCRGSPGLFSLC